jgi:ribose/xylose/arabinose/galactoside ABC-type transport system permease subunit
MKLFFTKHKKTLFLLLLFVLVWVVAIFESQVKGKAVVLNAANIRLLLIRIAPSGVMMVGMSCLLMSGSIDLSTDSQAMIAVLIFGVMLKKYPAVPWGVWLVPLVVLMVLIGLLHSFLTNKLGFMPFIATIATSSIYGGAAGILSNGAYIETSRQSFTWMATTAVLKIGGKPYIPVMAIIAAVIILVYALMLNYTRFGRSIYLCGGNRFAARLSGINPTRISTILFINNSVLALVGGLMFAANLKNVSYSAFSTAMISMSGMTAAILGGVSFMGGGATGLGGAAVGLILMNSFTFTLDYWKYPNFGAPVWDWLQTTLGGLILVIALIYDSFSAQSAMKKLIAANKAARQKNAAGGGAEKIEG